MKDGYSHKRSSAHVLVHLCHLVHEGRTWGLGQPAGTFRGRYWTIERHEEETQNRLSETGDLSVFLATSRTSEYFVTSGSRSDFSRSLHSVFGVLFACWVFRLWGFPISGEEQWRSHVKSHVLLPKRPEIWSGIFVHTVQSQFTGLNRTGASCCGEAPTVFRRNERRCLSFRFPFLTFSPCLFKGREPCCSQTLFFFCSFSLQGGMSTQLSAIWCCRTLDVEVGVIVAVVGLAVRAHSTMGRGRSFAIKAEKCRVSDSCFTITLFFEYQFRDNWTVPGWTSEGQMSEEALRYASRACQEGGRAGGSAYRVLRRSVKHNIMLLEEGPVKVPERQPFAFRKKSDNSVWQVGHRTCWRFLSLEEMTVEIQINPTFSKRSSRWWIQCQRQYPASNCRAGRGKIRLAGWERHRGHPSWFSEDMVQQTFDKAIYRKSLLFQTRRMSWWFRKENTKNNEDWKNFLRCTIRNHEQWVYSSTILTYWAVMTYLRSSSSSYCLEFERALPRSWNAAKYTR